MDTRFRAYARTQSVHFYRTAYLMEECLIRTMMVHFRGRGATTPRSETQEQANPSPYPDRVAKLALS